MVVHLARMMQGLQVVNVDSCIERLRDLHLIGVGR